MDNNKAVDNKHDNESSVNDTKVGAASVFELVVKPSGIAHLVINDASEKMNTLKASFVEEIAGVLKVVKANQAIKGLVIISGKPDSFIAGADIHMLDDCKTADDAKQLSQQGQYIFDLIEKLSIPVVAAIHGPCLGGGLELALACHQRVCSDDDKTVLGLPEVQLGLLPGGGGTQRLPKLVGLQKSLDMMLTGKQLRAKQAGKIGLVDAVVANDVLIEVAEKLLLAEQQVAPVKKQQSFLVKVLEGSFIGRKIIFQQAKKSVLAKTKGNYPAPLNIIKCVQAGVEQPAAKGYAIEAQLFAELVKSKESAQLRQLFFATTEMKKEQGIAGVEPKVVKKIAVLGGGLMGGGIAFVSATKAGLLVRVKDISHNGINAAIKYSYDLLNKKVKRRFLTNKQMQRQLNNITGTVDYSGFKNTDVVIEAVFEDLSLKQKMVAEIEQHCRQDVIFASNTSSLPIGQIAQQATRPENVIGLHYFSPVDKMPLAEIIAHDKTSDQTISTIVELAKRQGKTPIVVKDTAGFYVNRILAPYMNEAATLLLAGAPIDKLDKALVNFGFPVGPMQLLDEVGIDVGAKIGPILQTELGERFTPPAAFEKLITDGRLGKKVKKGFYLYSSKNSQKRLVDESVYKLLNIRVADTFNEEESHRCVYMMLNEAARCLDEGVVRSARDGDIGAIFGIGFPPFLGGPYRYMDSLGIDAVVATLNEYTAQLGERFTPCQLLKTMADEGKSFY
ncbi:MAG: fatty acid oxidation complex subunit alpha FadJ [Thalassotalea sp.]